ncbi:MAG: carboxypeptidase regulatory-like domain-containing protein, partial [Acidobacteria bacterium]|nr:carboxypeptidase regulatory-like domain-containing protein [Acidobacteriota bacterium]
MPIPGATVSIVADSSQQKISTWTDIDGRYSAILASSGRFVVRIHMAAFADATQEIVIDATHENVALNFELVLLSRVRQAGPGVTRSDREANGNRGFQRLNMTANPQGQESRGDSATDVVPAGMPIPGMAPESATESVLLSGNGSNAPIISRPDDFQPRLIDGSPPNLLLGGEGGFAGAAGGFGGGPGGGFTAPGSRGGRVVFGRRGFNVNHPHGSIYYGVGDSALNAAPYSLTGSPVIKPGYLQNNFGGSVGGPLNIPHVYNGGIKTFYFVNYNGRRGEQPFDQFSTVPTMLERQGNFSQTTYLTGPFAGRQVEIFNPQTNSPFLN